MPFKPPDCKRLQGAADARRRARRRPFVLQVPDNKADAVPCERLRKVLSKCRTVSRVIREPAGHFSLARVKGYLLLVC